MSYKIKILKPDQYKELLADNLTDKGEQVKIYLATILPGLFYSVNDKVVDHRREKFLYIPPGELSNEYSPTVFDRIVYKKIDFQYADISINTKKFIPILVENMVLGGLYGLADDLDQIDRSLLLDQYNVADYFGMVFNINDESIRSGAIAIEFFNRISKERTYNSFMQSLPSWILEILGGGYCSYYYKSGDNYILKKTMGQLSGFPEAPASIEGGMADSFSLAIENNILFLPVDPVPDNASEIKHVPRVRYLLGGCEGDNQGYLITGLMPYITSYSSALFIERLGRLLKGLSSQHFTREPEWCQLFSSLDELANTSKSSKLIAKQILKCLNEQIDISSVTLAAYHQQENRIEIKGTADLLENSALDNMSSFSAGGSIFESVVESGRNALIDIVMPNEENQMLFQMYNRGIRSVHISPIKSDDNFIGFIIIGSIDSGFCLKKLSPVFDTIAGYLAKLYYIRIEKHRVKSLSTQLEQLQNDLWAIENIKILGELAGGVFHDLNNIIGAILGRCQLAYRKAAKNKDNETVTSITKDITWIEKAAEDSGEILNRLRQLAQSRRKGKKESVNAKGLIEDAIEMVRPKWAKLIREQNLKLELKVALENDITVLGDPSELREVLTNLMLNALDAMPDGGMITVNSRRITDEVQIVINDTGTGMPSEVLNRIFDPFFTTKGVDGTGLGLSLSKKIIENHGGTLEARSTIGEGTSFIIQLPHFKHGSLKEIKSEPNSTRDFTEIF